MRFGRQPSRCRAGLPDRRRTADGWLRCRALTPVGAWARRRRYRVELRRLLATGHHLIADIGLEIDAVEREIAKPPWRR